MRRIEHRGERGALVGIELTDRDIPMHAWLREDHAHVKAYRKLARAGERPPIVLR